MKGLFLGIIVFILISGCTQVGTVDENGASEGATGETTFTFEEVSQHNTADDCWMIINGKVLDVTSFISSHPGGNAILEGCGKDATELFETRPMGSGTPHSTGARNRADALSIGGEE